jgi:hypothetical protein
MYQEPDARMYQEPDARMYQPLGVSRGEAGPLCITGKNPITCGVTSMLLAGNDRTFAGSLE